MHPNNYKNFPGIDANVKVDVPDKVYIKIFATIIAGGLVVFAIVGGVRLLTKQKQ